MGINGLIMMAVFDYQKKVWVRGYDVDGLR